MQSKIYLSVDGSFLGLADVDAAQYAKSCRNDEGHVRADDILSREDLVRLNLTGRETVYANAF